ncbi:hypothetical protein [Rufibacter sp. LB8]|uniref:DUF6929 family protein n=1 Tax=Rufibacter sp. LB8 TaxID=2777781 RepID=UPI00178C17A5|nr:hypothetical protein [Rufibacter sp. LB8]
MKPVLPFFSCLAFVTMTFFATGCQSSAETANNPPAAIITKKVSLKGIPSASGIERVGNRYYVIGDDSPYLFCLDQDFKLIDKIQLLQTDSLTAGRIPKPVKPDLEAITSITLEGMPYLFIIGSGSMPARNQGFLVPVGRSGLGKPISLSLQPLYQHFREDKNVVGQATLNLEGLAADEDYLYLLQRFAPGGQNVVITYTLSSIEQFLLGKRPAPKPTSVQQWALPDLASIKTGFSGMAPALGGKLLFTSSAEETPNAVLDGEVYGSMVGWLKAHPRPSAQPLQPEVIVPITEKDGAAYKSKIESICILDTHRRHLEAVAVADNDDGFSELVLLTFSW